MKNQTQRLSVLLEYLWRVLHLSRKYITLCLKRYTLPQLETRLRKNPQSLMMDLGLPIPRAKSVVSLGQQEAAPEKFLTRGDEAYPASLTNLHDAPYVIYYRGQLDLLEHPGPKITFVGTRRASAYAKRVCRYLIEQLAPLNPLILSGMAAGIDGVAHQTALDLGLKTIGILGTPLHRPYPAFHRALFQQMQTHGLLLTEVYPEAKMGPWRFPERNRLLAALGDATVVVEAPEKSGALITARVAAELGREVMVAPGELLPEQNGGGHRLIQEGAHLLRNAEEIVEILGLSPGPLSLFPKEENQVAPIEKNIEKLNVSKAYEGPAEGKEMLQLLGNHPMQIDKIIHISQKSASEVISLLMELHLEGWVEELPGAHFKLASS